MAWFNTLNSSGTLQPQTPEEEQSALDEINAQGGGEINAGHPQGMGDPVVYPSSLGMDSLALSPQYETAPPIPSGGNIAVNPIGAQQSGNQPQGQHQFAGGQTGELSAEDLSISSQLAGLIDQSNTDMSLWKSGGNVPAYGLSLPASERKGYGDKPMQVALRERIPETLSRINELEPKHREVEQKVMDYVSWVIKDTGSSMGDKLKGLTKAQNNLISIGARADRIKAVGGMIDDLRQYQAQENQVKQAEAKKVQQGQEMEFDKKKAEVAQANKEKDMALDREKKAVDIAFETIKLAKTEEELSAALKFLLERTSGVAQETLKSVREMAVVREAKLKEHSGFLRRAQEQTLALIDTNYNDDAQALQTLEQRVQEEERRFPDQKPVLRDALNHYWESRRFHEKQDLENQRFDMAVKLEARKIELRNKPVSKWTPEDHLWFDKWGRAPTILEQIGRAETPTPFSAPAPAPAGQANEDTKIEKLLNGIQF